MSRARADTRRIVLLLLASLVAIAIAAVGFAAATSERAYRDTGGTAGIPAPGTVVSPVWRAAASRT